MAAGLLDQNGLRQRVEQLAAFQRGSCSDGERRAAELIAADLRDFGLEPVVERERAHGTYWWPVGLPQAAAVAAGLRGGVLGAAVGTLAAASAADDVTVGPQLLRRLLPSRDTQNVWAEAGDPAADRTLVFMAHHDSAHSGLVFHPGLLRKTFDVLPDAVNRHTNTTPPTMWLAVAAPLAVAVGSLLRRRRLRVAGVVAAAGYAAAMADIGRSQVVPGANDNATGVAALLSLARALGSEPPAGVRVIVLFPGAEESFEEGMNRWSKRHFTHLPRESTTFICLDTVGSPRLALLEGEGMLGIHEYTKDVLAFVRSCLREIGVPHVPNLRFRNATDALIPLKAGYPTAMLGSVDEYKLPTNYHWPTDTADRVDYGTVEDTARLCLRIVERTAGAGAHSSRAHGGAYAPA